MVNVFDLMAPSSGKAADEEKLLRDTGTLAAKFVELLGEHVLDGELFGLEDKFRANELTSKLDSWQRRGDDDLLTPEQLRTVLGVDFLNDLEARLAATGDTAVPTGNELYAKLAKLLPVVVRRFTRSGQTPPERVLQKTAADLARSLMSKA